MSDDEKDAALVRVMKALKLDVTCNRITQFYNQIRTDPIPSLAVLMDNDIHPDPPNFTDVRLIIDDSVPDNGIPDVCDIFMHFSKIIKLEKEPLREISSNRTWFREAANSVIHYIYYEIGKNLSSNCRLYSIGETLFTLSLVLCSPRIIYASTITKTPSKSTHILGDIENVSHGSPNYTMWNSRVATFLISINPRNLENKPIPRLFYSNIGPPQNEATLVLSLEMFFDPWLELLNLCLIKEEVIIRSGAKAILDLKVTNGFSIAIEAKNRPIKTFFDSSPEQISILNQVTKYALAVGLSENKPKSIYIIGIDAVVKTIMEIVGVKKELGRDFKVIEISYMTHNYLDSEAYGLFAALSVLIQDVPLPCKLCAPVEEFNWEKYAHKEKLQKLK